MANNQVVTRDEFEAFLANPTGKGPLFDILRSIPKEQRQLLFNVGKSVCKIETDDDVGTGFHLGGGWILTALHVISDEDTMGAEYVSQLTFQFPNEPVIEAASRSCIFPILPPKSAIAEVNSAAAEVNSAAAEVNSAAAEVNSVAAKVNSATAKVNSAAAKVNSATAKVNSAAAKVNSATAEVNSATAEVNSATAEVKDIALVYVPEVTERESIIPGLGNPYQEPPETGDLAHLVHFGDDHQQFSINGKIIPNPKIKQPAGYSYSTFKAYSPSGSSGAPLLIFKEDITRFLVGGVHFEGGTTDKFGYALHFTKKNWLESTVLVASTTVAIILSDAFEGDYIIPFYENLQKHLKEHNLKIILNKSRPSFLAGEFENIIFKSE